MNRIELLERLVNFDCDIHFVVEELKKIAWDSNEPLVYLNKGIIIKMLSQYINDTITHTELIEWANAIECREDIGFEGSEENLSELIFEIANPEINPPFTKEYAEEFLNKLKE